MGGLTSVRGNRGENYENEPLVRQNNIKEKKLAVRMCQQDHFLVSTGLIFFFNQEPTLKLQNMIQRHY
jgi:hypothetical protein